MYRTFSVFVLLVSLNSFAAIDRVKALQTAGFIRTATEGAFPPFSFFKGKDLAGFEVDLVEAMAARLGVKTKWQSSSFDSLLIGLSQGRYDLVAASHAVTPERQKAVDFLNPHYCTGGVLISPSGGPRVIADLKGKVVGAGVGTTYSQKLPTIAGIGATKTYPSDLDAVQSLRARKIDSVMTDKFVAMDLMKQGKLADLQIGPLLFPETIAMAVHKGDQELLAAANKALEAVLQDGTYKTLSQKYFNEDIRCR